MNNRQWLFDSHPLGPAKVDTWRLSPKVSP
jgi:hypothetical protein